MVIDSRTFVISVVAIFFALAVGILIGSTVLTGDFLIEKQRDIVERLETDFERIKAESRISATAVRGLRGELEIARKFQQAVLPPLIRGRLEDKVVAVVETTGGQLYPDMLRALQAAGADIASVTTVEGRFEPRDRSGEEALRRALSLKGASVNTLMSAAASRLAEGLFAPESVPFVDLLADLELVRTFGRYGEPVDAVILVGGTWPGKRGTPRTVDVPIIRTLASHGITVVGAEGSDVDSFVSIYKRQGIPTVDNVDTVPGQLALVYALSGLSGDFGIKSTAESFLPDLEPEPAASRDAGGPGPGTDVGTSPGADGENSHDRDGVRPGVVPGG